jgi:hypothetical protein
MNSAISSLNELKVSVLEALNRGSTKAHADHELGHILAE